MSHFDFQSDKQRIRTILTSLRFEAQYRDYLELDKRLIVHNGGEQCDMYKGPCACGAWHREGDIERQFSWVYNNDNK